VNQPTFCWYVTWKSDGITLGNSSMNQTRFQHVFVGTNDTTYALETEINHIAMWTTSGLALINVSSDINASRAMFVSNYGDIYVDNGVANGRIDKWTANGTSYVTVMHINGGCSGLFIDIDNNFYCSMDPPHVVRRSQLSENMTNVTIVAGTNVSGSSSFMLDGPRGIFVDNDLSLYVADCNNNRIQYFKLGMLNGKSIVGQGAAGTIYLNCPTSVILDADGYIFIADQGNHRIVGSSYYGFRCIIGCTGQFGSAPNQLNYPSSISFDTSGHLFVADHFNGRIQKFMLASNSCSEFLDVN
jgi:hypothetical protein